jgi:hypothetical protein
VQELSVRPNVVRASQFPDLVTAGMERWIIIACQTSLKGGIHGLTEIVLDQKHNLYLLMVFVNKNLFTDDSHNLRKQRKMIAVHEFVHGSAYMIMSSTLRPERFVDIMNQSINSKMKMTTSDEFNAMLLAIGKLGSKIEPEHGLFSDGHFRLVGDGFMGNYTELYINLLLSYQLILETMTSITLQHSKEKDISTLLTLTFNELVDKKALDEIFVLGRMKLFLPVLYDKFA